MQCVQCVGNRMSNNRVRIKLDPAKLTKYVAIGGSVLAGAGSAEAGIIHLNVNTNVTDTTQDANPAGLNLVFGAANSFNLAIFHGIGSVGAPNRYAFALGNGLVTPGVSIASNNVGGFVYARNLTFGQQVDTVANFATSNTSAQLAFGNGYPNSQFKTPSTGFLGVRFNTNQYGWIRVNMAGAPDNSFTVVDYAFTTAGEGIFAGQIAPVPEPSSLALLASGAAGIAMWRKRMASRRSREKRSKDDALACSE